ncbi:MAG: PD-(D/E)XK nuclease family protein [Chloroflexota bacterium]
MPDTDERVEALERLIGNNPDLERLEAIVADFNPFVAMGWTHQEIRHSAFLRWFLDPKETHGLGSYPLRAFLMEVLSGGTDSSVPNVFDADTWDLDGAILQAEWENTDLLIRNDGEQFFVLIENKVRTSEHSNQLQRYREVVTGHYPEHHGIFIYLTPSGETPSDEEYRMLGYPQLVACVERVIERRKSQLSDEVRTFLNQYVELVRRHIVEDSEIQELCRRLYENHKAAFDLIYEHRPDRALEVSELLQAAIRNTPELTPAQSGKSNVRFSTDVLEEFPNGSDEWVKARNLILFELVNYNEKVVLRLILGPGDAEIREAIYNGVKARSDIFNKGKSKLYSKWWTFHGRPWIGQKAYAEKTLDELAEEINLTFSKFVEKELPDLENGLRAVRKELK